MRCRTSARSRPAHEMFEQKRSGILDKNAPTVEKLVAFCFKALFLLVVCCVSPRYTLRFCYSLLLIRQKNIFWQCPRHVCVCVREMTSGRKRMATHTPSTGRPSTLSSTSPTLMRPLESAAPPATTSSTTHKPFSLWTKNSPMPATALLAGSHAELQLRSHDDVSCCSRFCFNFSKIFSCCCAVETPMCSRAAQKFRNVSLLS